MAINNTFNVPRFLIIFFVLAIAFYAYIGIVSPGGKIYSSFLDEYANLPAWLTYLICKSAKGLLELFGYNVYQKRSNNITIVGSRGVNIIWACLGFRVLIFWVAFVTAHYATWSYKLKWVTIGIVLITAINILRIALIALGLHHNWKAFNAIEPHLAFNIVSYLAIFLLTFWFVIKFKNIKKADYNDLMKTPDNFK